jgi:hypothetical protein
MKVMANLTKLQKSIKGKSSYEQTTQLLSATSTAPAAQIVGTLRHPAALAHCFGLDASANACAYAAIFAL